MFISEHEKSETTEMARFIYLYGFQAISNSDMVYVGCHQHTVLDLMSKCN